ncbi:MAG TPA: hypothetical protein VLN73_03800 [Alphaproteobacteria bacterium]|nr:hypothetical protein [Alphaproteobacteria bacterium]
MGIKHALSATVAIAAVASCVAVLGAPVASAEDRVNSQLLMQMPGAKPMAQPDTDKPITVNIRYTFRFPLEDMQPATLSRVQNRGRRLIYRMADGECEVLKSTIADSCAMSGINVRSRVRKASGRRPAAISVNGNVRYSITLKQ